MGARPIVAAERETLGLSRRLRCGNGLGPADLLSIDIDGKLRILTGRLVLGHIKRN
jgi:hypothetical protein